MKKLLVLAFVLCIAGVAGYAQGAQKVIAGRPGMYPAFVAFGDGAEPPFVAGTVLLKEEDAFVPSTATVLLNVETDRLGMEHYRYQQKINNILVEGAVYIMHVKSGKVKSLNGDWIVVDAAGLLAAPSINECAAQKSAMSAFGAKKYKWQVPEEEAFIRAESGNEYASFAPKTELVYYSGEGPVTLEGMRLAWKINLYAHDPIGRRIYFIDAENGKVLGMREILHSTNASGTAITAFSGTQTVTTDQTSASSYRLRETGRGNGINTYNLKKSTSYSGASDFTDADNYWDNVNTAKDQYAPDAHWGAEKTYDYYYSKYGRNSINNAGFVLNSYVHYGNNYYNAFWDGNRMTYGDGSSSNGNKPLTSIDVCGHEISHGLTEFTANLNYSKESGALNEGFSDVLGTAIEFFAKGSDGNWTIGEDVGTFRSMSNPNQYGQPDTYKGTGWATGGSDYGGVHTNSGVLNFWFYLLSQGGSGTNDKGYTYVVTGIGVDDAAAIAYRTLTNYLISTSQFISARTYSLQAASDLFGATSTQVTQVGNAWDAVNVSGTSTTPPGCSDVYEANESKQAAKSIAVNTDISARIGSSTDKDWFKFSTTSSAAKIKVTISNLPADYDLRLYDNKGKQIGVSQNTGTASESISYNLSNGAANYYVQVGGYNGATSTSCYNLYVATSSVNQLIDDNDAEQNATISKGNEELLDNEGILVFPNPAKEKIMVQLSLEAAGTITLSITDFVGRVVMQQSLSLQAGSNTITLPLAKYSPGIYFLNASGKQSAKFQITE
jgi:bacillolysin